jgi:malyl-CoA/(S)-citramalyl-CoA lyase
MPRRHKSFFSPLALGAPQPPREIPFVPSRTIHFLDASNAKMVAKIPGMAKASDVILCNLEDAIAPENKIPAREGILVAAHDIKAAGAQCWVRINALDSPWVLDDLSFVVGECGADIDVIMVPKVEGPWDINFVDRYVSLLEARSGMTRPILLHAILETAEGVANIEEICESSPRMQGLSLGPADLAASRGMKTTRVGGGHPGYVVLADSNPDDAEAARAKYQQDLWHYTVARMVDACRASGLFAYYGPFGDIKDTAACEAQFQNAYLMGCVGAWSLHPAQIEIGNRVFSPPVDDVLMAKRIVEAMPAGGGVCMIDGKMQDDATWKQAMGILNFARALAERDPSLKERYGF